MSRPVLSFSPGLQDPKSHCVCTFEGSQEGTVMARAQASHGLVWPLLTPREAFRGSAFPVEL